MRQTVFMPNMGRNAGYESSSACRDLHIFTKDSEALFQPVRLCHWNERIPPAHNTRRLRKVSAFQWRLSMMFARRTSVRFSSSIEIIPSTKILLLILLMTAAFSIAQQAPQAAGGDGDSPNQSAPQNSPPQQKTTTIPAGTRVALVLTQPVDSKSTHRGQEIYAQTTAPVVVNDKVVIPAGTFVQSKVDKLARRGSRGEMSMQSVAFVFPNGYVADVLGPVVVESDEGTTFNNPGSGTKAGVIAAPLAGLGLGALIGSAAHTTHTSTLGGTSITSSTPAGVGIGSIVGLAAGGVVSLALLAHSHGFYFDVGSSMQMELPQLVTLDGEQIGAALKAVQTAPAQIVLKRLPPPLPSEDHGTCYTPGTPGTPDIVVPGISATGDSPGTPPTVIPGIPPTPPTPYPCP